MYSSSGVKLTAGILVSIGFGHQNTMTALGLTRSGLSAAIAASAPYLSTIDCVLQALNTILRPFFAMAHIHKQGLPTKHIQYLVIGSTKIEFSAGKRMSAISRRKSPKKIRFSSSRSRDIEYVGDLLYVSISDVKFTKST